jgi:hypothetical protein
MFAVPAVNVGTLINVLERFCIYEDIYNHNNLNDKSNLCHDRTFDHSRT